MDVWSLAVTMRELAVGALVFCGETKMQVAHEVMVALSAREHARLGEELIQHPDFQRVPTRLSGTKLRARAVETSLTPKRCRRLAASRNAAFAQLDGVSASFSEFLSTAMRVNPTHRSLPPVAPLPQSSVLLFSKII